METIEKSFPFKYTCIHTVPTKALSGEMEELF